MGDVAIPRRIRRERRLAAAIATIAWIAYVVGFIPIFKSSGVVTEALSVIPLAVTGFFLGTRAGLIAGFLNVPLNGILLAALGIDAWQSTIATWPGALMAMLLAAFAGSVSTLYNRVGDQARKLIQDRAALQAQVEERAKVEATLRRTHEELEQRVHDRTAELEETKERYRLISEVISDFAFAIRIGTDGKSVCEWAMGALTRSTGFEPRELNDWEQLVHPDDKQLVRNLVLHAGEKQDHEFRIVSKSGETHWLHAHVRAEWDPDMKRVLRYYVVAQDITDRKRMEDALRASEARSQALVNAMPDMLVRLNRSGLVLDYKPGKGSRTLIPTEMVIGKHLDDLLASESRLPGAAMRQFFVTLREALAQNESRTIESAVPMNGTTLFYETRMVVSGVDEVLGIIRDITERKQVEAERERLFEQVRVGRERLVELSQRLVETQEVEHRKIARELHDQVGQNLTGLSINLNIIRSQLSPEMSSKVGDRITDSLTLVGATVERVRDVMAELRPAVLDDYGLAAALRWLAKRFANQTGVESDLAASDKFPRLPIEKETALFRIAQEALNNTAKYAHARCVKLELEEVGQLVRLTIADDGLGFDTTAPRRQPDRMSWGLSLMRERSRGVGGDLYIHSQADRGTKIIAEVPR
ncbi:MAG: PAS domain S-box protein [Chloroflexi bacterium]|nr:PAS domain S-box protein [Chloroflexota bacterium]